MWSSSPCGMTKEQIQEQLREIEKFDFTKDLSEDSREFKTATCFLSNFVHPRPNNYDDFEHWARHLAFSIQKARQTAASNRGWLRDGGVNEQDPDASILFLTNRCAEHREKLKMTHTSGYPDVERKFATALVTAEVEFSGLTHPSKLAHAKALLAHSRKLSDIASEKSRTLEAMSRAGIPKTPRTKAPEKFCQELQDLSLFRMHSSSGSAERDRETKRDRDLRRQTMLREAEENGWEIPAYALDRGTGWY